MLLFLFLRERSRAGEREIKKKREDKEKFLIKKIRRLGPSLRVPYS